MSNEWRWETKNNDAIMAAMGDEDRKHFSIDLRSLNWGDYISALAILFITHHLMPTRRERHARHQEAYAEGGHT